MQVDISVIIPSAGKWSRLGHTLQGLVRQRLPAGVSWEVIVVLDGVVEAPGGAPGGAPDRLLGWRDALPLRIEFTTARRGRGAARNMGVACARGEFAIFLDDDVVAVEDLVEHHLNVQKQAPRLCHGPLRELPALACIADLDTLEPVRACTERTRRRLQGVARTVMDALEQPSACWERFGQATRIERDGMDALAANRLEAAWVAFAGANLSAPTAWLHEHGFDERPGSRWGLEDLALALRLAWKGYPLGVAAGARALHLSHQRTGWKQAQRDNVCCLDFLPAWAIASILAYLEGDLPVAELGAALAPLFSRPCT